MGRDHRTCILGALEMGGGPRMSLQNAANTNSRSSLLRRSLISSEFLTFSSAMHTRSLCCCRILHPSACLITNDSTATNVVGLCTTAFLPVRTHSPYRRGNQQSINLKSHSYRAERQLRNRWTSTKKEGGSGNSVCSSPNSPKGLESLFNICKFRLRHQSAGEGLLRSLAEQIGREAREGAVIERAAGGSHGHRAVP